MPISFSLIKSSFSFLLRRYLGLNNLVGVIVSAIYIAAVVVTSKFMSKFGEEASRKFIHVLLSNVWIIYMLFIDSLVPACILPIAFVIINTLSYKFKLIKSMEREENDGFGTIYYAVSMLVVSIIAYVAGDPRIGATGILIMGYGDGFAAIIGKKIKSKKYKIGKTTKSIAGSLTMFIIRLFISFIVLKMIGVKYLIFDSFGIAVVATILEAISIKGFDNITVPVITTILTFLAM